ncbi:hypothetical protein MMMDOFMJ_3361 [Methylobacterium gnaphalii]|nr:hypothetical protein MMMDOFMJ_3361 [Methylobacterium gnaphalii]
MQGRQTAPCVFWSLAGETPLSIVNNNRSQSVMREEPLLEP